ncbi:MAG TPA: hypothetical protein VL551_07850 [Actinospica sp.]|jgi:hypothetical protein|nr:hypothetical protein [Actinospica sp.]
MPGDADLLRRIRGNTELALFFAEYPEFDIAGSDYGDDPRVASGTVLEAIAGDGTGGAFYLCGADASERPVLYASSEGEAGIIARGFAEAVDLMSGLPYWRDCLGYSDNGDLETMQQVATLLRSDLLANHPDADADQTRAAELLGRARTPVPLLVTRLHAAVASAGSGFVFSDATGEYGGLFGPFAPSRNTSWQDRLEHI